MNNLPTLACLLAIILTLAARSTHGAPARYNYSHALELSILFFDAQRSGKLPANNPIPWRGDSALGDKGTDGEDLTGGWYDAGDHVKFGFPMAASTVNLLWGYLQWPGGYKNQESQFLDSIKWPLDYFLKAWIPSKQKLYIQVGNGQADHSFWGRPEDMTMARPAYTVTASKPGSDVAGNTATALAAGSMAFKSRDSTYSQKLLSAAESLYDFAKAHSGVYSRSVPETGNFYGSTHSEDEMCEAAIWLYKATKQQKYLDDAKHFVPDKWAWALSWEDKTIACQVLLYEQTKDHRYLAQFNGYQNAWLPLPGNGVSYTPCGLAWRDMWGSLRYAANAALIALVAADSDIETDTLRTWALGQINYILGDNNYCLSYEIGFGSKYPTHPHHRAASCPDRPASCDHSQLSVPTPSPQLLKGGLVGGPDQNDKYEDLRTDYTHNEVACDYNAGFQSVLAGLIHLEHNNALPAAPTPKCHC